MDETNANGKGWIPVRGPRASVQLAVFDCPLGTEAEFSILGSADGVAWWEIARSRVCQVGKSMLLLRSLKGLAWLDVVGSVSGTGLVRYKRSVEFSQDPPHRDLPPRPEKEPDPGAAPDQSSGSDPSV